MTIANNWIFVFWCIFYSPHGLAVTFHQRRTGLHPCILTWALSPNTTTWQGLCDSFWTLSVLLSLSEILISRHVSPAGAFPSCHKGCQLLWHSITPSVPAITKVPQLGHRRSLHPSSDWRIWPGQESKFRSLKWDAENIWQGSQVWCNGTCSFWYFPVLLLQKKSSVYMCPSKFVYVVLSIQSLKFLRKPELVMGVEVNNSTTQSCMYLHLKCLSAARHFWLLQKHPFFLVVVLTFFSKDVAGSQVAYIVKPVLVAILWFSVPCKVHLG